MKLKHSIIVILLTALTGLPGSVRAEYAFVSSFGSFGTGVGQFDSPRGVAVDNSGQIVVTESGNHRVQICSTLGSCTAWGSFGVESGEFDRPRGVAVNSLGRIFVADRGNDRIENCSSTGICTDFGGSGTQVGKFESPRGVAITGTDRIVVTDTDHNRIQVCTEQGVCTAFGSLGSALGQFNSPAGVAVNSQGLLVIADRGNNRIQICTEAGSCSAFGSAGTAPGRFDTPAGVAVDSQDRIVVVDRFNDRVQVCDELGVCSAFGSLGTGDGQFDLPWGVAVDDQDRIIVADLGNHRLQIFSESTSVAIGSFTATPNSIPAGQSVLFSWAVSNATQCTPLGGTPAWTSLNLNASGGNASVQIDIAGDYLFTLQCTDGVDTVSRSVTVTVTPVTPDFLMNAGLNDAWFNPATPGQGFFVNIFPVIGQMFVAWFTFETERPDASVTAILGEPGHRWITAFGPFDGNSATLAIEITSGGVFNSPEPAVTQLPGGTLTIVFHGCNSGTISYSMPLLGLEGVVPIERVALDNVALCESLSGPE